MLQPGRTKYRKAFRGHMGGASKGNLVEFGEYGLKATQCGWISANSLESARRAIAHATKRNGKMWCRIFPDKPWTKKEGHMGAGKGDVKGYVAVVKPGRIIFEVSANTKEEAARALYLAAAKLPVTSIIVNRL